MNSVESIAEQADMIINGYAYKYENQRIKVVNLHKLNKVTVFSVDMELLETSMDDIEIEIILGYLNSSREFMEMKYA